jgi:hypothetical protein
MSSIDHPSPTSSPPDAEGGTTSETRSAFAFIAGGAHGVVGTPRFGRGMVPTVARS